ncbi:MAG: FTR1 family iron permease [Oscillospiraceae bacterium]|jgi:high-affinity iron transporter|nr:FTR1 family iron permease [Oscillospiraceae bacterium]
MISRRGWTGRKAVAARLLLLLALATLLAAPAPAAAEQAASARWGDAADAIDKYLDAAFEYYLDGESSSAYNAVNDAYFRVYEVTGFERQTLSYISGPRKNAVELQYSVCKGAVKKGAADEEIKKEVRASLNKLKAMIREDGNKLAAKDGEAPTETKYYLRGELVDYDPYADLAGDPNAVVRYANWAEASDAVGELLDTAFTAYKGKDYEATLDNVNTAYYSVYEESGLSHKIFTDLSLEEREEVDARFAGLKEIATGEKFLRNAFQRETRELRNLINAKAAAIDTKEAEAKAILAAEALAAAPAEETTRGNPKLLVFLASFGIIAREGLEAILIVAAIIAYMVKSGNGRSLRNVYVGAIAGIACSFLAAWGFAAAKSAWAGAGQSQEVIEGVTALIAVCVLFYVSNWMISKSEAAAWSGFIDSKVQSSVARGSSFALAFTAFLSVFREGAEVVLFYQPMLGEGSPEMVWAGLGVGCVMLVFIYLAISKLSIKLPIKVFFTATSVLMALMCVSFLGAGIKELAEGGVFDATLRVPGIPENEILQILGIHPYLETLAPQLALAVILLITFMVAHYRGKLKAAVRGTVSDGAAL